MKSAQKYLFLVCLFTTLVSATQIVRADVVDPHNLPKPVILACGEEACNIGNNVCYNGLACVPAKDGKQYCAKPERYNACAANPTTLACCGFVTTQPVTDTTAPATTTPAVPKKNDPSKKTN